MSAFLLSSHRWHWPLARLFPGVTITVIVAVATLGVDMFGPPAVLSPVILAILVGMLTTTAIGPQPRAQPGVVFCSHTLLRVAVALLGCQITFADLLAFGLQGVAAILAVVLMTLGITLAVGRALGLDRNLSALLAAGTAICGASAIAGVNGTLRSRDEHVAYAIGVITIYGTIGMLAYPLLGPTLGLTDAQYGIWAGLSLHEVAQAVAAGFAAGDSAGQAAVTMKLGRVLLLAAVVAVFARIRLNGAQNNAGPTRQPLVPWFLAVFLVLAGLNSLGLVPAELREGASVATRGLMLMAMAGIGLGTNVGQLARLGLQPMVAGGIATVTISVLGLGFALLIG